MARKAAKEKTEVRGVLFKRDIIESSNGRKASQGLSFHLPACEEEVWG